MTKDELIAHCEIARFEWADGKHEGKPGVFLRVPWLDKGEDDPITHIPLDVLPNVAWPAVRRFAVAGRDVQQFSRIVGYLSRIENWNRSKLGELRDRHKGRYGIEEETEHQTTEVTQ